MSVAPLCFSLTHAIECARQPKGFRECVSTRDKYPRRLLYRVVRVPPPARPQVRLDEGNGRSAYICKTLEAVVHARRKNRAARALRAYVPNVIYEELEYRVRQEGRPWTHSGLWHCDVYGVAGTQAPVDDVMDGSWTEGLHPDGDECCGVW